MNQLVSFSKNVSFMFGKKRGRRPVFNSNMFYPHAAERELQGATREEFLRFIAEALAVAEIGTQFADDISELSDFDPKLPDAFVEEISKVASDIEKKAMSNFSNQSEMIIGKPYYPPEVKGEILTNWESNFQMLCKSAETDAKKDLARLLQQGKEEGWNKNRLEKAIKSELSDKYRNRAELIARTETAKLNTQINLDTYRNIGVEYYTWMTTIDGRERESHAAMNGLICSVSDPDVYFNENPDDPLHPIKIDRTPDMVHMHPGEDFQCRCSMVAWDPYINGSYEVKEMPEEEPEEKEPTPLEKAREETAKAEERAERTEEGIEKADVLSKKLKAEIERSYKDLVAVRETASVNLVKEKFPNEIWEKENGIHISLARKSEAETGNEPGKLEKEKFISKILVDEGHSVWLVPEKKNMNIGGKRPDAIVDGKFAEMKLVTGQRKKIWDRLVYATTQSKDYAFIATDKKYSVQDVINTIKGKFMKAMSDNPKYAYPFDFNEFFFISSDKEIHRINLKEIWNAAKIKGASK